MEKPDTFEIIYRMIAILALVLMALVIGFGWLKGYIWEKDTKLRKRHRY